MNGKLFLVVFAFACLALASCNIEETRRQRKELDFFLGRNSHRLSDDKLYQRTIDGLNSTPSNFRGYKIAEKLVMIGNTNGCSQEVLEALNEFKGHDIREPKNDMERMLKLAIKDAKLTGECKDAAKALAAGPRED